MAPNDSPAIACADCGHAHLVETGECNPNPTICNCEWFQPEGTQPMRKLEIPLYVDPAVLEVGAQIECVLDGTRTPLTVLRVEPALICAAPDGTELVVLAHTAVTLLPTEDGA
jgi:hypothetical protein